MSRSEGIDRAWTRGRACLAIACRYWAALRAGLDADCDCAKCRAPLRAERMAQWHRAHVRAAKVYEARRVRVPRAELAATGAAS